MLKFFLKQTSLLLVSFFGLGVCNHAFAQQSSLAEQIKKQIRSGEIVAAWDQIKKMRPGAGQDHLLVDLAEVQLQMGACHAALKTATFISAETYRESLLKKIKQKPVENAFGGQTEADFEPLIDLITSTIAPNTWNDNGGNGAINEFIGGVLIDTGGLLIKQSLSDQPEILKQLQREMISRATSRDRALQQEVALRKVSLTRLERVLQQRKMEGRKPTAAMRYFAGLRKIRYLFVFPETGEIVVAGPAGDWKFDQQGRAISKKTARPLLHLEDFITILRNQFGPRPGFGCSIYPTQANLLKTKTYLRDSKKIPLKVVGREKWIAQLRENLGNQRIDVYGVSSRSRVSRVMVEADYHMKQIGMGLEPGVFGVTSYLKSIELGKGKKPPQMDILRWYFTIYRPSVKTNRQKNLFQFSGKSVQVLSENELLGKQGKRIHTGKSSHLNRKFARSFTKRYAALSRKYPIYADLNQLFDLALVAATMKQEQLPERVGWKLHYFLNSKECFVAEGIAPKKVASIVNHRVIHEQAARKRHIIVGVSGGVRVRPQAYLKKTKVQTDKNPLLDRQREYAKPSPKIDSWWWD